MEDEFIKKLREKYEKGEISKETYEDILKRYLQEISGEKVEKESPEYEEYAEGIEQEVKENRDYKCAGSCVLGPGIYGQISASGSIKITGDIKAERISVAGSLVSEGSIKADLIRVGGSAKIHGDLKADDIGLSGSISVSNITGDTIRIGGSIECNMLEGEDTSIGGAVKAKRIKSETLKIKLNGKSVVDIIDAENIEIIGKKGFFRKASGKMVSESIKGETIYLECTHAKSVEGENITIGDYCDIDVVKGETIKVSKNSTVKRVVKK